MKKKNAFSGTLSTFRCIQTRDLYLTKVFNNIIMGNHTNEVVSGSKPNQVLIVFDWLAFKEYLSKTYNNSPKTVKVRLCYAKKFYHELLRNDVMHDLLAIESAQKRLNVMKWLTVLSKYLGCYDKWREMHRRYNIKWTARNEFLHAQQ